VTYKSYLTGVNEWLGGEPFPHECARSPIIDRVDQPTNIIFDYITAKQLKNYALKEMRGHTLELQLVRRPALLQGHDVRHGLAAAADARNADGAPLEVRNAVIFRVCSRDDCPAIGSVSLLRGTGMRLWRTNSMAC
jgi:hypothetical protein